MIENGIARFNIAQKIDQRDLVSLRARERAHNEVAISRRKPRPTIRLNHRDLIMRERRAYGKSHYNGVLRNTVIVVAKGRRRPVVRPAPPSTFPPARSKPH